MNHTLRAMTDSRYHKLGLIDTRVLHAILAHERAGVAHPSYKTIAKIVFPWWTEDKSVPSRLLKAIKRIEELGIFRVERGGGRRRYNQYHLAVAEETSSAGTRPLTRNKRRAIRSETSSDSIGNVERSGKKRRVPAPDRTHNSSQELNSTLISGSGGEGLPSASRVRREKRILRSFESLGEGVRSNALVKRALHDQGLDWMQQLVAEARGKDNPAAFAVWALKNPEKVRLNGEAHDYEDDHTVGVAVEEAKPNRVRLEIDYEADWLDCEEDDVVERCEVCGCNGIVKDGKCATGHAQRGWDRWS